MEKSIPGFDCDAECTKNYTTHMTEEIAIGIYTGFYKRLEYINNCQTYQEKFIELEKLEKQIEHTKLSFGSLFSLLEDDYTELIFIIKQKQGRYRDKFYRHLKHYLYSEIYTEKTKRLYIHRHRNAIKRFLFVDKNYLKNFMSLPFTEELYLYEPTT